MHPLFMELYKDMKKNSRFMREFEVTWCLSMLSIWAKYFNGKKKGYFGNRNHRCTNLLQIKYTYFKSDKAGLNGVFHLPVSKTECVGNSVDEFHPHETHFTPWNF